MKKNNYGIENEKFIYHRKIEETFRSNPLGWIVRKIREYNDVEGESNIFIIVLYIFLYGVFIVFIAFCMNATLFEQIRADKTPRELQGPIEIEYFRFSNGRGGYGSKVYIYTPDRILMASCYGLYESYCDGDGSKTTYSKDYTLTYASRYTGEEMDDSVFIIKVVRQQGEDKEIIFENKKSLGSFLRLVYYFSLLSFVFMTYSIFGFIDSIRVFFRLLKE